MIRVNKIFLNGLSSAIFVVSYDGGIIYSNKHAEQLSERKGLKNAQSIVEVDARFLHAISMGQKSECWEYCVDGICVKASLFQAEFEDRGLCYLCIFDNYELQTQEFERIIDSFQGGIAVVDRKGFLRKMNKEYVRLLEGIDITQYIDKHLDDIIKMGALKESLSLKIFKARKSLDMNIKYNNNRMVTLSGVPVFDEKNEICQIVCAGRDVTELVLLKERLSKMQNENEGYLDRIKELEEYLGDKRIIYSSDAMKRIIRVVDKAAKTDSSIFLLGESGVGKEVLARLIHDVSVRKGQPFVSVNCAAIPEELLEAELFGYEEGAFTGARKGGKRGLLEEANRGTIFLDEIGELPYKMQSKLLRVIQEGELRRVGGNTLVSFDVRYISATNLTFDQISDSKRFRRDLYFRLGVIPIFVPPLRERKEDILPLLQYYLKHFNQKYKSNLRLSYYVIEEMHKYNWPGNVRELRNVIERLIILEESDIVSDINFQAFGGGGSTAVPSEQLHEEGKMTGKLYKEHEETLILNVLDREPNVVKAAQILGIAPSTIYRKMKRGKK
ncbi:MAG TPA: sigma 54-interacting transcriptional regulator [Negativicutes bacterium]